MVIFFIVSVLLEYIMNFATPMYIEDRNESKPFIFLLLMRSILSAMAVSYM